MLGWGDLLLTKGGTDRDREVESGIQHKAATLGARLQAACPRGLQPMESTKPRFTVRGCNINSLTHRGTKTRPGQTHAFCDADCDVTGSCRLAIALICSNCARPLKTTVIQVLQRVTAYHYVSPPFSLSKL